jgi:RNA polymerase sigma-70 factor (ECF subfamily)
MDTDAVDREQRFTELFTAHHATIVAYARRRVVSDVLDDVVADTFLAAWLNLDRQSGDPVIWLYSLARGAVSHQRRRLGRIAALDERASAMEPRTQHLDGTSHVGWEDPFLAAFARLTEPERDALRATVWEGLTPTEGAAVQGCTVAAFKVRLHRARRRLRKLLDAHGAVDPALGDLRASGLSTTLPLIHAAPRGRASTDF